MNYVSEVSTYYYRFKGEVNTDHVLRSTVNRAMELDIETVVVASETGRSALKALKIIEELGANIQLVVVTHPPDKTWEPKGEIPIDIYSSRAPF